MAPLLTTLQVVHRLPALFYCWILCAKRKTSSSPKYCNNFLINNLQWYYKKGDKYYNRSDHFCLMLLRLSCFFATSWVLWCRWPGTYFPTYLGDFPVCLLSHMHTKRQESSFLGTCRALREDHLPWKSTEIWKGKRTWLCSVTKGAQHTAVGSLAQP